MVSKLRHTRGGPGTRSLPAQRGRAAVLGTRGPGDRDLAGHGGRGARSGHGLFGPGRDAVAGWTSSGGAAWGSAWAASWPAWAWTLLDRPLVARCPLGRSAHGHHDFAAEQRSLRIPSPYVDAVLLRRVPDVIRPH